MHEDVLDVVFPSDDEATKSVHPGEEPLHFPASASVINAAACAHPGVCICGSNGSGHRKAPCRKLSGPDISLSYGNYSNKKTSHKLLQTQQLYPL